jgi:cystathionine gamma-synthase
VDVTDPAELAAALRPQTALVWLESPSNPLLRITDIPAAARIAHGAGAVVVVDSTLASPYLQRPLALGADVVLHSTTKYLSGHGDVTGGAIVAADPHIGQRLAQYTGMLGTMASPFDAWLTLRGIQTLPTRMRQICTSAQRLAEHLHQHPAVARVHYPGLPDHPDHRLAARQMPNGYGGVVSVELHASPEAVAQVCARTRLFTLAVSLGGTESLIEQPALMSHRSTHGSPAAVPPTLIRLAIGLEDPNELIHDLNHALTQS